MSADLTVIVLTYNEERNIARALRSVLGWAAQVCVVDSYSRDQTRQICSAFPGVDLVHHAFEDYGRQWNWALENLAIETDWVMKLDADEALTPELRREIGSAIEGASPQVAAFSVWRKFIFMGKWLQRTVGRCHDVRIWRRGRARFEHRSVNEHLVADGPVRRLRSPLLHEDRKGVSAWMWRHNRYSTMEAEEFYRATREEARPSERGVAWRRCVKEKIWPWVPCKPLVCFLYLAVFRLGFLDGRAGLTYAGLRSFYYYLTEVKKRERRITGEVSSPEVMR